MENSLRQLAEKWLEKVSQTEESKQLFSQYDDVVFQYKTDEPFYLHFKDGQGTISSGESDMPAYKKTVLGGDTGTLKDIIYGKARIVDAVWDGKIVAEVYGPKCHYVSWLSQMFKIGRKNIMFNELMRED